MDSMSQDHTKKVIEAILLVNEKPVMLEQIQEVLGTVTPAAIRLLIDELKSEYQAQQRGMVIVEIAGGFQMLSNPQYAAHIREFFKVRVKEKLSRPALETLAIVAYKQPVSRLDIELIRGVNSDGVVAHLLEKGLIKIVGRKDVPGRPYLFGTTKQFLEYFGLKSLDDLPKLEEFPSLVSETENKQMIVQESDPQQKEEVSANAAGPRAVDLKEAMEQMNETQTTEPHNTEESKGEEITQTQNNIAASIQTDQESLNKANQD